MENIKAIKKWFKFQCNGDWEHEYGVQIQTISNPGWSVQIDLSDTVLDGFIIDEDIDNGNDDWFFIKSDGKIFSGSGDFNKLNIILDKFVSFALHNIRKSNYIYTIYAEISLSSDLRIFRPIEAKMIDLSSFEVICTPKIDIKDLKVLDIKDFEKINFKELDLNTNFSIGDTVKCDLMYFYDYPSIVISGRVSDEGNVSDMLI